MTCGLAPFAREPALELPREYHRIVVHLVVRRVDERDGAASRSIREPGEGRTRGLDVQLPLVTLAKLREPARIVAEPSPKLVARCDVLEPVIEMGIGFAQSARPQPFDENAVSVAAFWRFVRSLEVDHDHMKHEHRSCLPGSYQRVGGVRIRSFITT